MSDIKGNRLDRAQTGISHLNGIIRTEGNAYKDFWEGLDKSGRETVTTMHLGNFN